MCHFLVNISLVLIIAVGLYSSAAYANITNVTGTPSTVSVPAIGNANINITWQVFRTNITAGTAVTSSPTALLQIQGTTVATLGNQLSRSSNIPVSGVETLQFRETLTISAALSRRIANSPSGSVQIIRAFDDQQQTPPVTSQIRVASGQNNNLNLTIRRIDLSFDNQARTDVIHQGESLRAIVDLSFRSSGVLKGEWRLIDPSASLGQSSGRILQVVQKNLVSSGEGRTRIISPPLPSQQTGLYLLAFAVQQDIGGVETPILRYFVLDKTRNSLSETASIETLSPPNRAPLSNSTVFSWKPVENAHAYQVAIFNKGDTVPISGKLITAQYQQLTLSDFSRDWLLPNYEYSWRVRAFDQQGNLIANSPIHHLTVPK